jgi:hypothetical protein
MQRYSARVMFAERNNKAKGDGNNKAKGDGKVYLQTDPCRI